MFKRIDISRLQNRFIELIHTYQDRNDMTQKDLAGMVNMKASVLSNILRTKRNLSANYLLNFIIGGIIMVDEINDGQAIDARERNFWNLCSSSQRQSILTKMALIESQGFDIENVLDGFIKTIQIREKK